MCPAPQILTGVSLYPIAHTSRPTLEARLGVENKSNPMTPIFWGSLATKSIFDHFEMNFEASEAERTILLYNSYPLLPCTVSPPSKIHVVVKSK